MSGAIYVLKWSTGTVKVGRSMTPAKRIAHHQHLAKMFGVLLEDQCIVECANYQHAEMLLIRWASTQSADVVGREWCVGLGFDDACAFAKSLADATPPVESGADNVFVMKKAEAIILAGSQAKLASLLKVSRQAVNLWSEDLSPTRSAQVRDAFSSPDQARYTESFGDWRDVKFQTTPDIRAVDTKRMREQLKSIRNLSDFSRKHNIPRRTLVRVIGADNEPAIGTKLLILKAFKRENKRKG